MLFRIIRKRIFPKYRYKREKIQYEHGDGQKRGDGDEKYRVTFIKKARETAAIKSRGTAIRQSFG